MIDDEQNGRRTDRHGSDRLIAKVRSPILLAVASCLKDHQPDTDRTSLLYVESTFVSKLALKSKFLCKSAVDLL